MQIGIFCTREAVTGNEVKIWCLRAKKEVVRVWRSQNFVSTGGSYAELSPFRISDDGLTEVSTLYGTALMHIEDAKISELFLFMLDVWLLQVYGVKKILWSGVEDGEINAVCQVLEMVNHGCCLKIGGTRLRMRMLIQAQCERDCSRIRRLPRMLEACSFAWIV